MSATELTGRFILSKISKYTLEFLDNVAPFHLLGLKALIGVRARTFESMGKIGPCAEKLYAVLPAGVATRTPSQTSSSILMVSSICILILAASFVSLKTDISFIAMPLIVSPFSVL